MAAVIREVRGGTATDTRRVAAAWSSHTCRLRWASPPPRCRGRPAPAPGPGTARSSAACATARVTEPRSAGREISATRIGSALAMSQGQQGVELRQAVRRKRRRRRAANRGWEASTSLAGSPSASAREGAPAAAASSAQATAGDEAKAGEGGAYSLAMDTGRVASARASRPGSLSVIVAAVALPSTAAAHGPVDPRGVQLPGAHRPGPGRDGRQGDRRRSAPLAAR